MQFFKFLYLVYFLLLKHAISTVKLLQSTNTFLLPFILPSSSFSRQEQVQPGLTKSLQVIKMSRFAQFINFSASRYNLLNWSPPPRPCQSAIYQKLKQKHGRKHKMKSKPCLNFTSLQWPVPSVTQSKWLKLMPYNVWSDKCRVTKTNKKERSRKKRRKKKREERNEEQRRGAVTFSSGGWRAPSLLVKEELFHPAITESLSPH